MVFWPYERTTSGPFTTTISEKNFELVDNFFETPSNKVSDDLIFYEAMIWMDSGVVTLYQFDNDYMPFIDMDGNVSDEEAFAYRESLRHHEFHRDAKSHLRSSWSMRVEGLCH